MKYKNIVLSIVLMLISILIHFTHIVVDNFPLYITLFSIIPIYIISRNDPSIGILAYIGAFMIIFLLDYYEGLIFILLNGLLGIFLGMLSHYINKKLLISIITSIILFISINGIMIITKYTNIYIQGLNVLLFQFSVFIISIIISLTSLIICDYIYNKVLLIKSL